MKTYGDKPISFQLEEGGEYYYVGSEASCNFAFDAKGSAFQFSFLMI